MADLYIGRLYYFEMWESPLCLKTVADVTAVRRRSIVRTSNRATRLLMACAIPSKRDPLRPCC
eukprot:7381739-Prymnesium_polylepis.1